MGVALFIIHKQGQEGNEHFKPVAPLIVAAQAATVLASPLVAGTLLWLTNKESVMGQYTNGMILNIIGFIGLGVLVLMSVKILVKFATPDEAEKTANPHHKTITRLAPADCLQKIIFIHG